MSKTEETDGGSKEMFTQNLSTKPTQTDKQNRENRQEMDKC